jgi:hypothetical protein
MLPSSRPGLSFFNFPTLVNPGWIFLTARGFSGLSVLPGKYFRKVSQGINAIIGSYCSAVTGEAVPVPGIDGPYAKIPAGFNIPSRAVTHKHGFTGAGIQHLECKAERLRVRFFHLYHVVADHTTKKFQ